MGVDVLLLFVACAQRDEETSLRDVYNIGSGAQQRERRPAHDADPLLVSGAKDPAFNGVYKADIADIAGANILS